MSGCLLFIMVLDLQSAGRSEVDIGAVAGVLKKERGVKEARKWDEGSMVSEQLQNISKHIGSHTFSFLISIEGKGSQNSVQLIGKMFLELYSSIYRSIYLYSSIYRFINQIREENQEISKTSHIEHSPFPCFL